MSSLMTHCIRTLRSALPLLLLAGATGLALAPDDAQAQSRALGFPISKVIFLPKSLGVCAGPAKGLTISPPSATLPNATQGGPCFSQSFTVTNVGSVPVAVSNAFASDNNFCDQTSTMTATGCASQTLAPGGTCGISVQFCAAAASCPGTRNGSVTVLSDVPGPSLVASIAGTVIAAVPPPTPGISWAPTSINFGNVLQGTATPPTQSVTVTSTGTAPLTVTSAVTSPPFSVTGNTCGAPMASGQTCVVSVTYTPTVGVGFESGSLAIISNAGTPGVPLTGTGVAPPGYVLDSLSFGSVDQGSAPVVLTSFFFNYGTTPVTPSSASITGSTNGFTIFSDLCTGVPVAANGGSCSVAVRFTPPAPTTIQVFHSDSLNVGLATFAVSATLQATSIPPAAAVTLSPGPTFSFGNVPASTLSLCKDFIYTNTSATNQAVFQLVAPSGQFNTCTPSIAQCASFPTFSTNEILAPGAACRVGYQFAPTFGGPQSGTIYAYDPFRAIYMSSIAIDGTGTGPIISITPNSFLSFGSHVAGTSAPTQTLTVTNTGTSNLSIASVTLPTVGDFPVTDNCAPYPRVLGIGASCSLVVGFTPATIAFYSGGITIASNAVGGSGFVFLDGQGVAVPVPSADFYPMSLSFGNVSVGTTSPVMSFSFANTGSAPMTISSVSVTGTNAGDFAVSHNCPLSPSTLAPNTCCTVQATFTPTIGGTATTPETASIQIATDAAGSPHVVPLDGVSVPPPSIAAAAVGFPDTIVGASSAPVRIVVKNTGTTSITLGTFTIAGPFSLPPIVSPPPSPPPPPSSTCNSGLVLAIGATCYVDIIFTPPGVGASSGQLLVPYTGGYLSPGIFNLSGNGVPPFFPGIGVSADVVDFGDVVINTASTRTISVTSTGTGPLNVVGVRTIQSIFSATTDCGSGIPPGASCTVQVSCRPTALVRVDGDLYVDHNATGGFKHVSLICRGAPLPIPKIDVSLTSIGFGNQALGTTSAKQRVIIKSVGTAPLAIGGVSTAVPFGVETDCPASLAEGSSCTADATFRTACGGFTLGSLAIRSNDPSRPTASVELTGTGCRPFSVGAGRRGQNLCGP